MDLEKKKVYQGTHPEPSCIFILSSGDLLKLFKGEANATELFMNQSLKIDGDISVAMQFQSVADKLDPAMLDSVSAGGGGSSGGGSSSGFRSDAAFQYIGKKLGEDKNVAA